MYPVELLNNDTVIRLNGGGDKFAPKKRIFHPHEIRQTLSNVGEELQDKWLCEGALCKVLAPNHPWRTGKIMFQIYFVFTDRLPEGFTPQTPQRGTVYAPLLFQHSMGLGELLDDQVVISMDDETDRYGEKNETFFLPSELRHAAWGHYGGSSWLHSGVVCSLLMPHHPWHQARMTFQVSFIADLPVPELMEVSGSPDETAVDEDVAILSPLDEIRRSHL